jgi:hypothetical protein
MSTDVLSGGQIADVLAKALGRPITAQLITPTDLARLAQTGQASLPSFMDPAYADGVFQGLVQTHDGRMDHSAVTTTTIEDLLGRPPVHLEEWATLNREALLGRHS